jgi:hypothetical protein
MAHDEKQWLSRKEAALFLTRLGYPISAGTLANMASNNNAGRGPSFTRYSWRKISYNRLELLQWVQQQARRVA